MKWQLSLPYLPLLSSDFRSVVELFYEATGVEGGVDDCVDVVQSSLPFVVSRLYTKSEVLNGTRERVREERSRVHVYEECTYTVEPLYKGHSEYRTPL